MVALGEYGGFRENRIGQCPVEHERAAVCAESNEVRLTFLDEMQHGHLVANAEQARASIERSFSGIEFAKALENGHGT